MEPYYQDDAVTIYHGDCREILPTLPKVDAVVTDPPYGVNFKGKSAKLRDGRTNFRAGGYTFGEDSPEYIGDVVVPVVEALIEITRSVVLTPGTASLWLYPPAVDVGCWFSAAGTGRSSWGFRCSQPILYYGKDVYLSKGLGARANSVGQSYPNDANQWGHPCAKPYRFVRWLVNRASLERETILDPFMGSGTTLRAAKNLGRKAIGIESEEKYCEIAAKRMAQGVLEFGAANG